MREKQWLRLILLLFVLLGVTYALVTPVFEASDELWHYPMIRHLADGNPLPVQVYDPAQAGPWKQEASQPPLYYYLGAALTFWIDTSDMARVRWLNPHVDNGLITVDGNVNLAIHDPAFNPWQGTLLAVRVVRIFSVFLGAATVYLTYLLGKEVAPERPEIGLGATAVTAFLPMFLFISGAVNNDNLAIPLASLGVLLLIRAVTRGPETAVGYWLLIGVVIGLAVLTKQGTFALLPLAWGTAFIVRWRATTARKADVWRRLGRALAGSLLNFGVTLLPVLLIAGWWYWRNIQLYGDFLGWSAFIAVLGARAQPASLAQLWDERWGFMMAYWGLFGGVNVPMWRWIYHLLNGVAAAAAIGLVFYLGREVNDLRLKIKEEGMRLQSLIINLLNFVSERFAFIVCLLFAGAVVYGLVQWATTTWSSQGRLVFTALSALHVLLLVGLVGWLPPRPARGVAAGLGAFMLVIAALAPFLWIRPAYQPEAYRPPRPFLLQPARLTFGERLRLTGYAVEPPTTGTMAVSPGQYVDVTLSWEVLAPMARDWSVFVHLQDPVLGAPIAQRDMYHGQGLRPTSLLTPGEELTTFYRLWAPETAVSPANLQVRVGVYDFATGERLPLDGGGDAATLAALALQPVAGELPNPTAVNFMNELELVGYELTPRRVRPGGTVHLTVYVQAKRPLTTDYTFFAQVIDLETLTRWAGQDPGQPTSSWNPGETQPVAMALTLAEETPPGVYPVILGMYTVDEAGNFNRLQLVTGDGRITQDDFLLLTQIRVE